MLGVNFLVKDPLTDLGAGMSLVSVFDLYISVSCSCS